MGRPKRYSNWLNLANKPFEKDHIELPVDSTPWYSAWRVKQLPKLATFSRFTVPKSPYGCETGSSKGWTVCWRGIALDVRRLCPMTNNENLQTYWTAALWHMDSHRASGHVQWLPESLMKNFLFLITRLMFHVSFMNSSFPSNVPRRRWPKLTKHINPDGFATNIPTLKKSQNRRSGHPLRGRSELPARPNPLSNMGEDRFSAGNTDYGAEKHAQNIRHNRAVLCQISLPLSEGLQCRNIHRVSRTNFAMLFPAKSISDSRQCIVPQRQRRVGVVCRPPKIHRSLQPPRVFSPVQCIREDMASHTSSRYTQSILCIPGRASLCLDFNVSEHPEKTVSGYGLSTSVSIIIMSLYLCNVI